MFSISCPRPSAAAWCFEAKPWAAGRTQEHFVPWQSILHLSAAALPPALLSREGWNFLLCERTVHGALGAEALRNTRGVRWPTWDVGAGGSQDGLDTEAVLLPDTQMLSQRCRVAGQVLPLLLHCWGPL